MIVKVSNTLASRVTWAMTATVALFVGLMAVLAFSVMYEQEDELADQLVQIEMRRLIGRLQHGDIRPGLATVALGPGLTAYIGDHPAESTDLPVELQGLAAGPHELETRSRVLHALVAESEFGRITVVFDATRNERRVSEFGIVLLLLWTLCVVAGYWLARATALLVVGPMHAVTERIAAWDPDVAHASEQLPLTSDEAGRMLEAFNRMQDRVDRSIAREREFAANLGHEVRTPLAALRTDIEMAELDVAATALQRQRFARMVHAVDEIGSTISAARALSQAQVFSAPQTFALDRLVDDIWEGLAARAGSARLTMVNRIPDGHAVFADRYALLIVVRNLIGNAIDHAAPATVVVSVDAGDLLVTDDGPGIAAAALPFVFDRYHHGRLVDQGNAANTPTSEHGLGLAIARRVCEQQGWMLDVRERPDGSAHGTCFGVRFDKNST